MPVASCTCVRYAVNGLILAVSPKAVHREIGLSAVALQNKSSTLSIERPYQPHLKTYLE